MTEAELQRTLADDSAPNVPQVLPGHQGSVERVPVEQARERRALMTAALANGISRDAIVQQFENKYGMNPDSVGALMADVRAMWDDEDAEAARYAKGAARRRITGHIREASKDRKFTAVANLEKVLADVEGTNVNDDELPADLNSRLSDAVLHILGAAETKDVRIMIESQRMFIELGERDGTVVEAKVLPKSKGG